MNPVSHGDIDLRHLLSDAIAKSGKTRPEIAVEMSEQTGCRITKAMLDAWTAVSKPKWRFPFVFAVAFEKATGTRSLTAMLSESHALSLIGKKDELYLRLGQAAHQRAELDSKTGLLIGQIRELQ